MVLPQGRAGVTSGDVAVLPEAFILILAYTNWLVLSSRQTVIRGLRAVALESAMISWWLIGMIAAVLLSLEF